MQPKKKPRVQNKHMDQLMQITSPSQHRWKFLRLMIIFNVLLPFVTFRETEWTLIKTPNLFEISPEKVFGPLKDTCKTPNLQRYVGCLGSYNECPLDDIGRQPSPTNTSDDLSPNQRSSIPKNEYIYIYIYIAYKLWLHPETGIQNPYWSCYSRLLLPMFPKKKTA